MELIKRLINEEEGQGLVEYSLILALIAVVAIALLTDTGTQIKAQLQKVVTALTPAA